MVVLVLVLVWLAVLVPLGLRRLADRQAISSVALFRDGLRHLSRARPSLEEDVIEHTASPVLDKPARARRRRTVERRRRVLTGFGAGILATFTFGAIPAMRPLWYFSLVGLILGCCYVAGLAYVVRLEVMSAERRKKVVPITARGVDYGTVARPVLSVRAVGSTYGELPPAFRILDHGARR